MLAYNEKSQALADLEIANRKLQKNLIKSRALEISNHLADGRLMETIDTLINLLPNENHPEIPYVAEVEQVLRQAYDSLRYGNGSICRFVGKESFRYAVYSPDDKYIAAASNDSTVILWNAKTFEKKHVLLGHKDMVDCVNFSLDGKNLVSYAYDGSLIVWDVESGNPIMKYDVFADQRNNGLFDEEYDRRSGRCEFNNKGNRIIAAVSGIGCHIIDIETGQLKNVLPQGVFGTTSLSAHFMPNDLDVVTNVTGNLIIWKPELNDTVLLVNGESEYDIKNPIISKDGKMIAYSSNHFVKILSPNGSLIKSIDLGHSTYEMDFSNDSRYIATATFDTHGLINVIDVNEGIIIKSQSENKYLVLSAKFSHDDNRIVTSCVDNSCRVFNTGFSPIRFVYEKSDFSWKKGGDSLYITRGTIIEGGLFCYGRNYAYKDTIATIYVGDDEINDVLYNDTNNIFILGHNTLRIISYDGTTKKTWNVKDSIAFMDISKDNKYMAYAIQDEKKKKTLIKIMRISDFSEINHFYTDFYMWRALFTKDNRLWLAGNNAIFVYDIFTGECLARGYGDDEDRLIYEGLNIDGKHFLTYNPTDIDDMSLKVWNIYDLALVWKISGFSRKPIESSFGRDGKTIITSNYEDGTKIYKFMPLSEIIRRCKEFFGK